MDPTVGAEIEGIMRRKSIICCMQAYAAVSKLPCKPNQCESIFFLKSIESVNETLEKFGARILTLADGSYDLDHISVHTGRNKEELLESLTVKAISSEDISFFLRSLLSRLAVALRTLSPWLPESFIGSFDFVLTGGGGYEGGFMLEYEVNPAASFPIVYWPDAAKFTEEHIDRYTMSRPDSLWETAVFNILCDLPHEVVHLLQGCTGQVIPPGPDDGWLAEHDPSIVSINLLAHALSPLNTVSSVVHSSGDNTDGLIRIGLARSSDACADTTQTPDNISPMPPQPPLSHCDVIDDEYCVPGLLETVRLLMADRVLRFHNSEHVSVSTVNGYHRWRKSCGYDNPEVDSASVGADYLKIRAAFEAYPIDVAYQLEAFFRSRQGNIREQERPPKDSYCVEDEKSLFELLGIEETKLS